MLNRRDVMKILGSGAALAMRRPEALADVLAKNRSVEGKSPAELAGDEDYWGTIRQAYTVDPQIINLNNGGVAPAPRGVIDTEKRGIDIQNLIPSYYMWRQMDPKLESTRRDLARMFGCDPEELAITRNASEGLEALIFGLDLKPGDEVLATDQNYPRMAQSWRQRRAREGILFNPLPMPAPPDRWSDLTKAFEKAITPKTRVIEVCHITNLTGQIYPVREIVDMARKKGIEVIVDGAHAFAHFPFTRDELDCDYYATSLHKWLGAPIGTGFLYVRKSKIGSVWPLMAAPDEKKDDIRKFEEIGTHPSAIPYAIGEAIAFNHAIGIARKAERLRFLRKRWADRIVNVSNAKVLTPDDPQQSCGLGFVEIHDVDPTAIVSHLMEKHGIFTVGINHTQFKGLRISPNVYTQLREVDLFSEVLEKVLKSGLK